MRSLGRVLLFTFQTGTLRGVHFDLFYRLSALPALCEKLQQSYLSSSALFIMAALLLKKNLHLFVFFSVL
ncbi:hypothetical protein BANAU_2748 [Bacillus velezensis YAU B9601-Y2]|nr:hypothetical protein BANAU_2748 [Bacillus velezensis YAU B9601-Y2]